ncbi:MAG: LemA family protein [Prevotella sp.]|jgi:LemA protein|nr:LemA family protein [Prevotella sp.]MDY4161041.1 LemA family protein [Prevotella sp.]
MVLIVLLGLVVFLIIVAVAVFLWFVSTQRELVNLDEKCNNALSQIKVQLNSRWDALLALAKSASAYAKHESETLIKTIQSRQTTEVRTAGDVNQQQTAFNEVLGRLMAVREAYPELKASDLFEKTMDGVKEYEENVRMSRMIYNDTATRMNRYVRQWPSSFVANMLHFDVKEYLNVDDQKKESMPDLFPES